MRLMIRAGFDRFSGYGNDAVDMALHLEKQGVDVLPMPMGVVPGLPRKFLRLLEKDPRGPKDAVLTFAPPFDCKPWEYRKAAPVRVVWSMWERTPLLPDDFGARRWGDFDPYADETGVARLEAKRAWAGDTELLLVTCPMNVEAFRNVDDRVPIEVQPCGVDVDDWPVQRRDHDRMTFMSVGMLNGRKNPFALLEVWKELKADMPEFDAKLVMHSLAPGLHPAAEEYYGPDLTISLKALDRDGLRRLYYDADVLVSTSRGEGNNKPAMEFMASGGTVIATDWSGHQNWLSRECTFPVAGKLVPSSAKGAEEFEVDRAGLREALLAAWRDPGRTSEMGMASSRFVASALSWPNVCEELVRQIEKVSR
jgi:glycosyltransferase involved in cell wall biosynthesis